MVALPQVAIPDPTLEAVDRALVEASRREEKRTYLGMSIIGHPCGRKLWYDLHTSAREDFDAATLKRFADGNHGETIMINRLRMVPGITLLDIDPDTGRQWRFEDFGGMFAGHMDGAILGLLQAPRAWHVYEHKQVNEKKQTDLVRLKEIKGEKHALQAWDPVYYSQAVLYMHYSGMDRHYLTCSTPGGRHTVSVRTDADPEHAEAMRDKAKRIIEARAALAKLSGDPSWWQCKFCSHRVMCHGLKAAA